jgi:hypothetical protein
MEILRASLVGARLKIPDSIRVGVAIASDLSVSYEAGQLHFGPLQAPIAGRVANVNDTPSRALLDDVDLFQGHELVVIFFEHFEFSSLLCVFIIT